MMRDPESLIDQALMNTPPEYSVPEDPGENLMDLFRRYDELTEK